MGRISQKKQQGFLVLVLLVVTGGSGFLLNGRRVQAARSQRHGDAGDTTGGADYLYLIDLAGEFVRVNLNQQTVDEFWRIDGLDSVFTRPAECSLQPGTDREPPAYCQIDITDMRYDPVQRRVYVVAPDSAKNVEDTEESASYKIYVFSLAHMRLVKAFNVSQADGVMVTADGKAILVQHYRYGKINAVDVMDSGSFEKVRTLVSRDTTPPAFGPKAVFLAQSNTSVAGYIRTNWNWTGGAFSSTAIEPRAGLTEIDRAKLKPFEREDARTHERLLLASPGGTADGKAIFYVTASDGKQMGVWTSDPLTGETTPAIVSSMGRAALTPDGRKLWIAESVTEAGKANRVRFTGRFFLYDVATGKLITQYSDDRLAVIEAEGGPACFSPDGETLAYLLKDRLLTVEVSTGKFRELQLHLLTTATNVSERICFFQ